MYMQREQGVATKRGIGETAAYIAKLRDRNITRERILHGGEASISSVITGYTLAAKRQPRVPSSLTRILGGAHQVHQLKRDKGDGGKLCFSAVEAKEGAAPPLAVVYCESSPLVPLCTCTHTHTHTQGPAYQMVRITGYKQFPSTQYCHVGNERTCVA